MGKTIVAIHGVGDSEKGIISNDLTKLLDLGVAEKRTLVINGVTYTEIINKESTNNIIEVNWSDVMKPKKGLGGVLRHIALLLTSMLAIAEENFKDRLSNLGITNSFLNPAKLLRWLMEGFMLGVTILPIIVSIGKYGELVDRKIYIPSYCLPNNMICITSNMVCMLSIFGAYTWCIYKGSKYSKNYRWSWLCCIGMVTSIFLVTFNTGKLDNDSLMEMVISLRTIVIGAIMVVWLVIFVLALTNYLYNLKIDDKADNENILTTLAHLYIPSIAINSLGAILIYTYLKLLGIKEKSWLSFNLEKLEVMGTFVYVTIGLIPIIIAVLYFIKRDLPKNVKDYPELNDKGRIVQEGIKWLIFIAPLLLVTMIIYAIILMREGIPSEKYLDDIYKIAILRVYPYIFWIVGPLAIIVDSMGDFLFYKSPKSLVTHSIQEACDKRLNDVLQYAANQKDSEIVIVSHSWGSVIANNVLGKNEYNCKLITLGSPLASLCERFLGDEILPPKGDVDWINAYRYGDYVAGPIKRIPIENKIISNGGHTNYWSQLEVKDLFTPRK